MYFSDLFVLTNTFCDNYIFMVIRVHDVNFIANPFAGICPEDV